MSWRVLEVLTTPNPNARKFVVDRAIAERSTGFFNAEAAEAHPIARRLFEISGVTTVLLLGDFVTVNKSPPAKWPEIVKRVTQVLASKEIM